MLSNPPAQGCATPGPCPRAASRRQCLLASEAARLERALEGDPAALEATLAELVPVVRATALRELARRSREPLGRARQEADDMVQDVLLKLLGGNQSKLHGWAPERGASLAGYVRVLTRHHVADVLRRKRTNPFAERPTEPCQLDAELAHGPDPERLAAGRQELRAVIERARGCLSARGFEMFRRLWLDAEPIGAICAATGQTPASVYQWKRRIQLAL
jgi:DNA-directed RNA polymerase specialized sigma24 family protein